jgi:hypothetical protein
LALSEQTTTFVLLGKSPCAAQTKSLNEAQATISAAYDVVKQTARREE